MSSLIENLEWRYATKKMNGVAVPQEKVDIILEAARLAPTSSGLQPFEILVVTNPELKQQIRAIANDQSQVTDASHVLIFAAWDDLDAKRINDMFLYTTRERGLPDDRMDSYKNYLLSVYGSKTAEENFQATARQAYIGFGIAIAAAAEQRVDATPMEGFNAPALDELLNLKEKGLRSVTLLPLGYRDEANDWLHGMKKVRKPKEQFITELS
ncbi:MULTISPECIES: nitroreductase family protein [unclassified Siphonobacter]|uniref:nitroreductase family protein n=1 Tax=unclassified Siphonobacter TaxID=2635712 RepID=UPI00277EA7D9|nr:MULTISPECIES: nitroreductase family protein [unclassified Siphonobacter]MDQ1088701.1 nitroreductase/dihydropteridine reductase [Siphonobacter sp. SORGH_AS_1065]MDR6194846.1 nitroreductase/dihydropteridine reductase [Siphonobacter sp. SORGH_AS_0500]